jgi:hypothetical protein
LSKGKRKAKKKISQARKIRVMERKCRVLNDSCTFLQGEIVKLVGIIRRLGSNEEIKYFDFLKTVPIEANTKITKHFGALRETWSNDRDDLIEEAKEELAKELVKEIMESNAIRYIVRVPQQYDGPLGTTGTIVAARIDVHPWYQITEREKNDDGAGMGTAAD